MKIYLLRHVETKYNEDGLMQGRINTELSKKGLRHAEELRKKLLNYDIDICFSSPLLRSMQTAFTIVGDRCLINRDDRLIERDLGEFEGKSIDDYNLDLYYNFKLNMGNNGVERIQDVYERVDNFLTYLKENYNDKNILIVSHSVVIRCIHNIVHNCIDNPLNVEINNGYIEEIEL